MANDTARTGVRPGTQIDFESCLLQVDASKQWFARRVLPLTLEQLRWRPDPKSWSIGECLDHLNIALALYLPKVDDALARARSGVPVGNRLHADWEMEVLRMVEPPVEVRLESPTCTMPPVATDPERLVESFHGTRDQYVRALQQASRLDVTAVCIVEPIYPRIRSLGGTLAYLAAHDRRHIWQAERVRQAARFPRAVGGEMV